MKCDLLLKGGRVIDPANAIDAPMDVAISGQRIGLVREGIPSSSARRVADVSGCLVVPGLIDMHAHVFGIGGSMNPDDICLPYGVTTMLDAGGAGWRTFDDFSRTVIPSAVVRIFALINIIGHGMIGRHQFEQNLEDMDARATADAIVRAGNYCVGVKVAHYEGPGWEPLDRAVEAARLSGTWVMVDQNALSTRTTDKMLLEHMGPGDVLTHVFAFNKPLVDAEGTVKKHFWEARERGIQMDTGHGNASFSFRMAVPAVEQGFGPDTISTDLHRGSFQSSFPTMPEVMSKFLAIGVNLNDVIERSTTAPARQMGHPELGTLTVGGCADVAVLELAEGDFGLGDNGVSGYRVMKTDRRLVNQMTIRNGRVVYDINGRARDDWTNTPPPDTSLP